METPKPKPVARPSIRLTVKSGKDTRGPGGSHHQKPAPNRKKQNQRQKSTKPKKQEILWNGYGNNITYCVVAADTEKEARELIFEQVGWYPDTVEKAKFHIYLIEGVDADISEVKAVCAEHAKHIYVEKIGGAIFSITKKPFTPKEHLTDRPFANLRDLMKEGVR